MALVRSLKRSCDEFSQNVSNSSSGSASQDSKSAILNAYPWSSPISQEGKIMCFNLFPHLKRKKTWPTPMYRWAAKEAAIKAVKPRKVTHRDVEILQDRDTKELYALIQDHSNVLGAPYFRIKHLDLQNNSPAESEEKEPSVPSQGSVPNLESQEQQENPDDSAAQVAKISISHDADYATAVCLAAEDPIPGDVGGEAAARLFSEP